MDGRIGRTGPSMLSIARPPRSSVGRARCGSVLFRVDPWHIHGMVRTLVIGVCCVAAVAQAPQRFELDEMTAAQMQEAMASGRYTARHLVELYTARIEEIDRRGPTLGSVIELNPDALVTTDSLDAERMACMVRGPLHIITYANKDRMDPCARMLTTAVSLAFDRVMASRGTLIV